MIRNGSFGQWLRQRRKALDLTQTDLANQVGCSVMTVRKMERDERRPSKQMAECLADALVIAPEQRGVFLAFARRAVGTPPVPAVPASSESCHNLPPQLTAFVGRAGELAHIADCLADPVCRLLTLVGPGGIGKTRLALQAAVGQLGIFADGVYIVSLASVNSPDLIGPAIASALKISLQGQEDPTVQIVQYLREKHMLLVMDNFEQLLTAASLLIELLANSLKLKILVTSRERLNVREEWVFTLVGLSYPEGPAGHSITSYSAVQLFVQRARQVQTTFSLADNARAVMRICQAVEGMPLALELAATWLRVMPCQQIAEQIERGLDFLTTPLRDMPERHRSLRAVFEQSWQLLSEAERAVLMKLSVFHKGFDLEAAEAVAGASLALVASLADRSLLRLAQPGRYDLHELLRQFAFDKLLQAGEVEPTRTRHLEYYTQWAEAVEPKLHGREQVAWFDRVDAEHDNLRSALAWATEGTAEAGLRLAAALAWFWSIRGYWIEAEAWLDKVLTKANAVPTIAQADALLAKGLFAWDLRDARAVAIALYSESLTFYRECGDKQRIAIALCHLSRPCRHGDPPQAAALLGEAYQLCQELGDKRGTANVLYLEGDLALDITKDYDLAVEHLQASLRLFREVGDIFGIAHALLSLAELPRRHQDVSQAQALLEESLELFRQLRDRSYTAWTLYILASLARSTGDYERAQSLIEQSLALRRGMGATREVVYCIATLGGIALGRGHPEQAVRLFGALGTYMCAVSARLSTAHTDFENDVATARAQLGEEAFNRAWAAGETMTLEQAIPYALHGAENEEMG
jgi:predicted ATPase/DNA-binding XRE family transcriptional regulator